MYKFIFFAVTDNTVYFQPRHLKGELKMIQVVLAAWTVQSYTEDNEILQTVVTDADNIQQ